MMKFSTLAKKFLAPFPKSWEKWTTINVDLVTFCFYIILRLAFLAVIIFNFLYTFGIDVFNYIPLYQAIFLCYYFFVVAMGFYPLDVILGVVDQIPYWIGLGKNNDLLIKGLGSLDSFSSFVCLAALWFYSRNYHKAHKINDRLNGHTDSGFEIKEKGFLAIVVISYFILYLTKYVGDSVHTDYIQTVITETYYDIIVGVYVVYSIKNTIDEVNYLLGFCVIGGLTWIIAFVATIILRFIKPEDDESHTQDHTQEYITIIVYYFLNNMLTSMYLMLGAYCFKIYNDKNRHVQRQDVEGQIEQRKDEDSTDEDNDHRIVKLTERTSLVNG